MLSPLSSCERAIESCLVEMFMPQNSSSPRTDYRITWSLLLGAPGLRWRSLWPASSAFEESFVTGV